MNFLITIILSIAALVMAGPGESSHSGDPCQPFYPRDPAHPSTEDLFFAASHNPCSLSPGLFCSTKERVCRHCTDGDIPLPHWGCRMSDLSPEQAKKTDEILSQAHASSGAAKPATGKPKQPK
jgi:hypothetical protein